MAPIVFNIILSFLEISVLFWCEYQFMKWNSKTIRRKKRWYFVGFIFSAILMYLLAGICAILGYIWIPFLYFILSISILGYMLFHNSFKSILLDLAFTILLLLSMECGIYLVNNLILLVGSNDPLFFGNLTMVMKILFMLLTTMASVLWLRRHKTRRLQKKQFWALLILPLFCIFFFWSLISISSVYISLYGVVLVTVNIFFLIALNFYFFYLIGYLFRSNELEQELLIHRTQSELQLKHYKEMEEKYQASRKVLHDMKNHLQAVEHLYQTENAKSQQTASQYVDDLYHMLHILGEQFYSSNRMLNIIFNDKFSQARHKGILVKTQIGDVDFSDIRDLDITTIFANLLDNAIEAAQNSCASPYIHIKIQNIQEFRVISIVNSMTPQFSMEPKKGHHGLGLLNVKQTLSQYNGTFHQENTEQEYCISIMLPNASGCPSEIKES